MFLMTAMMSRSLVVTQLHGVNIDGENCYVVENVGAKKQMNVREEQGERERI